MNERWEDIIEQPLNHKEKYDYQILCTLINIANMLNKLMPVEERMAVEEQVVEEITTDVPKDVDIKDMTKSELQDKCTELNIEFNSRDTKATLLEKIEEVL